VDYLALFSLLMRMIKFYTNDTSIYSSLMPIACADFLAKYENSTKQLDYIDYTNGSTNTS
jgi:hypothetical protein